MVTGRNAREGVVGQPQKEGDSMGDRDPLYGWRWAAWFAVGCLAGLLILLRFVL